jgi:hypothetical protein
MTDDVATRQPKSIALQRAPMLRLLVLAAVAAAAAAPLPPRGYAQTNALERFGSAAAPRRALQPGVTQSLVNASGTLPRSGTWVTVEWAGLAAPDAAGDFVAWHAPADARLADDSAPVKFQTTRGLAAGTLRCAGKAGLDSEIPLR